MSAHVSEIMTTQVRTVPVGARLSDVRRTLMEGGFHHVPIVDGDSLVGILSSRDLLRIYRRLRKQGAEGIDALLDRHASIAEVMQTDLVTVRPEEPIERAVDLLADGAIHSLLVVDADDRLVGIATSVDVLGYLMR